MTQEQRDDARYEAIIIVNELHKTKDCSVYCRLIDLIDIIGLPAKTCTVEPSKSARLDENGLMTCGCGGKAILFHQPDIEGPGSDGDKWAVFCEKECGMETSDLTSREYAVETWNTGMGYKGGAAMERIDKPIGFDSILQGGEKLSLPDYEIFSNEVGSPTTQLDAKHAKKLTLGALAGTDAADRLRWLLAQAERVVTVDAEDKRAVERACQLLKQIDNGFDAVRDDR